MHYADRTTWKWRRRHRPGTKPRFLPWLTQELKPQVVAVSSGNGVSQAMIGTVHPEPNNGALHISASSRIEHWRAVQPKLALNLWAAVLDHGHRNSLYTRFVAPIYIPGQQ